MVMPRSHIKNLLLHFFMLINVLFHSVFWLKLNNFYSQWNIQIHIFMAETFPELELFLKIHVL